MIPHLVVYVHVKMFHQLSVGEAGVGFQGHEGDLCRRTEDVPASQSLFRQAHSLCHTLKWKHRMKPAKLTPIKTLAIFFYNIKFCKAQCWVNFPRFGRQTLFSGEYQKMQKSQLIRNTLCMN